MTYSRWKRGQPEEGAAVTEMAVLMFIFIPLVLFVSFTGDAMIHLLDVQETVIATTWDLSTQGFGSARTGQGASKGNAIIGVGAGRTGGVSAYNRLQYADHDSSFTNEARISGGTFGGGDSMEHHVQPFGHVCWCNGESDCDGVSPYANQDKAQQVRCQVSRGGPAEQFGLDLQGGAEAFRSSFGEGGVVECWAKGWLYNYLISDKFIADMPGAEKVPLFNKKRRGNSNVHTNAGDGSPSGDMLLKYRAGLLVDTWAITERRNVDLNDDSHPFYERTHKVFTHLPWYAVASAGVLNYTAQAMSKSLELVPSIPMGPPQIGPGMIGLPNPLGLWMVANYEGTNGTSANSYKAGGGLFGGGFFTTPLYSDNQNLTAHSNRGKYYLGQRNAQTR